jgi:lipid-A-disaccharide synthase-like uncharacterized protein
MSANPPHLVITRWKLIGFVAAELVLFLLANVTAKNSSHPGAVSNVFWVAFLVGAAILIVVALMTLVRRRRAVG